MLFIIVPTLLALGSSVLSTYNRLELMATGAMYERIGNIGCPKAPGTSLVYTGITVGFASGIGSTTYKCVPNTKEYIRYHKPSQSEYKNTTVYFVNVTRYLTFLNQTGNNVACAKCRIEGRNAV